jgi:hypothetical protein
MGRLLLCVDLGCVPWLLWSSRPRSLATRRLTPSTVPSRSTPTSSTSPRRAGHCTDGAGGARLTESGPDCGHGTGAGGLRSRPGPGLTHQGSALNHFRLCTAPQRADCWRGRLPHYSRAARKAAASASFRRASSAVTRAERSRSDLTWRISSRITSVAATSWPCAYPRRKPCRSAARSTVIRTCLCSLAAAPASSVCNSGAAAGDSVTACGMPFAAWAPDSSAAPGFCVGLMSSSTPPAVFHAR